MSYDKKGEIMSKTRFTKGKWSVGTGKLEGGVVDETNELICDPSGGRFEDEAKANAALISAAPEMYDMLEEVKEKIDRYARISIGHSMGAGWTRGQAKGFFMECVEINKRIKAVLQKARGKK